jgi:hypothetical protein
MSEKLIVNELGVSRILRYSYGGLLLTLLAAIINPQAVSPIANALGTVLAPLAALGFGVGIYVVHRHVIGEFFLYPLLSFFHDFIDRKKGRLLANSTNCVKYIEELGVEKGDCRAAYIAARGTFFESSVREHLDIVHSELHMLWITVDETVLAGLYLAAKGRPTFLVFAISMIVAICAALADIHQHQLECHMLKMAARDGKLRIFFQETGYLLNTN